MAVLVPKQRLASLDQFRGYTVAGMFLVNYLGGFAACPYILRHHNTFCSYADTIMPAFFFAVGFSLRLSFGRRAIEEGLGRAYWHVVKRLLGLAVVAIFITYQAHPPLGRDFNWEHLKHLGFWHAIWPDALKREWFQTLMHIAVTSLWILPVIRAGVLLRFIYMLMSAGIHLGLSSWFYFDWVNGVPGAVNGPSGIDGGMLGFLTWTIPTMVGTFACDIALHPGSPGSKVGKMFAWGFLLAGVGWTLSCFTRWYDVPTATPVLTRQIPPKNKENGGGQPPKFATDPRFTDRGVFPVRADIERWWNDLKAGHWSKVLAEPPFVPPPHSRDGETVKANVLSREYWMSPAQRHGDEEKTTNYRKWNYWMMSQRAGSISYLTFGAGLSMLIYALFYILSDLGGIKVGVFRTLGSNALFGYVLHDIVGDAVHKFTPRDAPPLVMWISFAVFFYVCWLIIRSMEKKGIYIKL